MKKILLSGTAFLFMLTIQAQVIDIGEGAQVTDLSNNGIAVGNLGGMEHFIWSSEEGGRVVGQVTDLGVAGNETISADGSLISASVVNPNTGIEEVGVYSLATDEWTYLGGLGTVTMGSESSSWGMSSNGEHIVGIAWANASNAHATIWNGMEAPVDLGATTPNTNSRANDVSTDGTVVVGWAQNDMGFRMGVYWENGVQEIITDEDGNSMDEAMSVSADGQIITGITWDGNGFIWNRTEGFTIFTHENSNYITIISSISDDGKTAVGFSYNPMEGPLLGEGIIWEKENGFQKMNDYVQNLGFDNEGITFSVVTAISPDGKYLGGIGVNWDEQLAKGFVISIENALSVNAVDSQNIIGFYPNPAQDILYFSSKEPIVSVTMFNLLGQKALEIDQVNGDQINISQLNKGIYIAKVNTALGNKDFKIIKE